MMRWLLVAWLAIPLAYSQDQAASDRIDLAELCFTLAPIQEPEVDSAALRKAFETIVAAAKARVGSATTPEARIKCLNEILLTDRKVSYLSNEYWRDSTLAASALRNRGNCLSTTTLYVTVGQRLGLPIKAVTIPHHAFARWDDGKTRINIETTAGGVQTTDASYHDRDLWTDGDAELLAYGRSLGERQFAAVLHKMAAMHLSQAGKQDEALAELGRAKELWDDPEFELMRLAVVAKSGKWNDAAAGYQGLLKHASAHISTCAALALAQRLLDEAKPEAALPIELQCYRDAPKYLQQDVLSTISATHRALRHFGEAAVAQELATMLGHAEYGDFVSLAIMYKNAARLDDAVRCLRHALELNGENWNTRLILAGYLIRAGKEAEGWEMFKTVKEPRLDREFYLANTAWFYGSIGRKREFLDALEQALSAAQGPGILGYVATEVDFDQYRNDAEFKALLEKHRARLAGK